MRKGQDVGVMMVVGVGALLACYVMYRFLVDDERAGLVWPRDERPPRADMTQEWADLCERERRWK
jgi:hypothetical protein